MNFVREARPAVSLLLFLTAVLGFAYPMVVTGIAQAVMPAEAGGSLLYSRGELIGSRLIGQPFTEPRYFWGRPSATGPQGYNGLASGGSNLGPTNPSLLDQARARVEALSRAGSGGGRVPVELVTASGSGLDPDISPAAARFQAMRVARARQVSVEAVQALIDAHTTPPLLGLLGEPRVNVLELNLALDASH